MTEPDHQLLWLTDLNFHVIAAAIVSGVALFVVAVGLIVTRDVLRHRADNRAKIKSRCDEIDRGAR
jgi:hypothetical protein